MLLVGGISILSKNNHDVIVGVTLLMCGVVATLVTIRRWIRLTAGTILLKQKQSLTLNGGELSFREPTGQYELWIFCEVPFSRYHGHISITSGSMVESETIEVLRRNPLLGGLRSHFSPIVWRPPSGKSNAHTHCLVKFHLLPTFTNTIFNFRGTTHDVEVVTIIIKLI
jgi:hypothetical protein